MLIVSKAYMFHWLIPGSIFSTSSKGYYSISWGLDSLLDSHIFSGCLFLEVISLNLFNCKLPFSIWYFYFSVGARYSRASWIFWGCIHSLKYIYDTALWCICNCITDFVINIWFSIIFTLLTQYEIDQKYASNF